MRIVQTPARFYPYIGGTEQVAFYLSRGLVSKGHKVTVLCAREPNIKDWQVCGVEVKRLSYLTKIANTNITLSLFHRLLKGKYDIIHTHLPHPWSADISALVSVLKDKPLFLTYHNDIIGFGIKRRFAEIYNFCFLKFLLKRAEKIFVTRYEYIGRSSFLKPYSEKVVVTAPGVDLKKYRFLGNKNKDENSIFFLSVLDDFHRYKGLDVLLKSLRKVVGSISAKLYVGGNGNLLSYYKNMVIELGLTKNVVFLGKMKDEEVINYYNMCEVFVLPSVSYSQEGFGLVALEAMACKTPVIVSDVVGVASDVNRYKTGYVVPPNDVDSLANALFRLLNNKDIISKFGNNAYDLVLSKYSWKKHVNIVESEYLKAVR